MKHRLGIILSLLGVLALLYGTYHMFYIPTKPSHSLTVNELQRQTFIKEIWNSVTRDLKDKGYLKDSRLTTHGQAFIKDTVKSLMLRKVGKEALATNPELILLENLLSESIIASYTFLKWCPCILPSQRVDLAFQIARDVKKQFPDPTQKLTYVSLGAGDLLQDFVVLTTLLNEGYCHIHFIGIDFKYHHLVHITIADKKKLTSPGAPSQASEKIAHAMDAFKTQLEKKLADKPHLGCSLDIEPFTSAYTYINAVTKGLEEKANILVLADPTRYLPYLKVRDSKDANMVEFSDNGLMLIMAEPQKPKAYLPLDSSNVFLEEDLKAIKKLMSTSIDRNYLKTELIKYIDTWNKRNRSRRSLTYYTDPFITFQDLIRHTAAPTALAYGLYEKKDKKGSKVNKIEIQTYKNADVITPHIGRDLTTPGRHTKEYRELPLD